MYISMVLYVVCTPHNIRGMHLLHSQSQCTRAPARITRYNIIHSHIFVTNVKKKTTQVLLHISETRICRTNAVAPQSIRASPSALGPLFVPPESYLHEYCGVLCVSDRAAALFGRARVCSRFHTAGAYVFSFSIVTQNE